MACGGSSLISVTSSRMRPVLSFSSPVMRLTTVVLPAPLGPMSPTMRPGDADMLRSLTACTPPKLRDTLSRLSRAIGDVLGRDDALRAAAEPAAVRNPERIHDTVWKVNDDKHEQRPMDDQAVVRQRSRQLRKDA